MSRQSADERKTPARDAVEHRRRTSRHQRHEARAHLNGLLKDGMDLDEALPPVVMHDLGRKASPKPPKPQHPGRRPGFKVWKTPFWKRRRQLWQQRNAAERQLGSEG